jgi:hypothetical protein
MLSLSRAYGDLTEQAAITSRSYLDDQDAHGDTAMLSLPD